MLRWLVSNLVREKAGEKLREAVSNLVSDATNAAEAGAEEKPLPPCQMAFLFAVRLESEGLIGKLERRATTTCHAFTEHRGLLDDVSVVVAESGVGRVKATQATEDLLSLYKPKWLVSCGFAGGLIEPLRRGHILMPDQLVDDQGQNLSVGLKMAPETIATTRGLHVGRLLTVDHLVRTSEEKRQLGEQHEAMACDMETWAVADICQRHRTRFLSVRVISDTVNDRLPPEIDRLLDQQTMAAKVGAATGALFRRPSNLKELWRLRDDAMRASDRLASFLVSIMPQLPIAETK